MKRSGEVLDVAERTPRSIGAALRLVRGRVMQKLGALEHGSLIIDDRCDGSQFVCGATTEPGSGVVVRVFDPSFWTKLAFGGSVGAGESFAAGGWTCSDLSACLALLVRNRDALEALDRGTARAVAPLLAVYHAYRRNSARGARRNIAAHYDLGNEFFAAWLDPTMTYSAALFDDPLRASGDQLEAAQLRKYDRLCQRLELRPGDEVCEIGSGWGGMAMHMAGEYGCRVTTTTISRAQAALTRERIRARGLSDRIEVLERDYRELADPQVSPSYMGRFDALVSIEMIEAVGHRYLLAYFAACRRLLQPSGRFGLQAITIADRYFELARKNVDFIQRHIFPGCAIPSLGSLTKAACAQSDFRIVESVDFGVHYASTLRIWKQRFLAARQRLEELGYDLRFRRAFEFYFAYCEAGFAERQLGLLQMVLEPPSRSRMQSPANA